MAPEQAKEREGAIYMQHVCVTFSTSDSTLQENDSLVIVWLFCGGEGKHTESRIISPLKGEVTVLGIVLGLQYFSYLPRVK